jgi:hypothetical protein
MLVASFFSDLVTGEAVCAAGAAARGAARFGVGGAGVAAALALVVFFGTTARRLPRAGFAARDFGLLALAALVAGAARRAFVPALLPFGLGMYRLLPTRNASPP